MQNKSRRTIQRTLLQLLLGSVIGVGLILTVVAYFVSSPTTAEVLKGIGLSLFPAGIVAVLLSYFASQITELLLRETVEETIQQRLREDMEKIDTTVREGLDQLGVRMTALSPLLLSSADLGLEALHLTRAAALESFAPFLKVEAERALRGEGARIWIVSSSIKGFLEAAGQNFDGRRMMERVVASDCDLRIMMTDPRIADFRAQQEDRAEGEIPSEIRMNLAYLKRIGVSRGAVRFYPGAPTVFAVATMDRMLLNPYPYESEAFRCFTFVVQETNQRLDVFKQYLRYHHQEPWSRSREIPVDEWNRLSSASHEE